MDSKWERLRGRCVGRHARRSGRSNVANAKGNERPPTAQAEKRRIRPTCHHYPDTRMLSSLGLPAKTHQKALRPTIAVVQKYPCFSWAINPPMARRPRPWPSWPRVPATYLLRHCRSFDACVCMHTTCTAQASSPRATPRILLVLAASPRSRCSLGRRHATNGYRRGLAATDTDRQTDRRAERQAGRQASYTDEMRA